MYVYAEFPNALNAVDLSNLFEKIDYANYIGDCTIREYRCAVDMLTTKI